MKPPEMAGLIVQMIKLVCHYLTGDRAFKMSSNDL